MRCNYLFEFREFSALVKNSSFFNLDKTKLKRVSHNDTHRLYGEFILHEPVSHDIDVFAELYEKQGGEYRKTAYTFKSKACDAIEVDEAFWPSLAAAVEPTFPLKCDLPAGTYTFNGYLPDTSKLPPVVRSGDYMSKVKLTRNGEILQITECYFHIINKKGGLIGL